MKYQALGLVEVLGSANAIRVVDQMVKTSAVEFQTWHTRCGGHATVFLAGDVSAVSAAVDSVRENPPCDIVAADGCDGCRNAAFQCSVWFCRFKRLCQITKMTGESKHG